MLLDTLGSLQLSLVSYIYVEIAFPYVQTSGQAVNRCAEAQMPHPSHTQHPIVVNHIHMSLCCALPADCGMASHTIGWVRHETPSCSP